MEFEWDNIKSSKTEEERGFSFDTAALVFAGPVITKVDDRKDYGETRLISIGQADGLVLVVVYTYRGHTCRIISAREASTHEREAYYATLSRVAPGEPDAD